jgi:hypothetical protein
MQVNGSKGPLLHLSVANNCMQQRAAWLQHPA